MKLALLMLVFASLLNAGTFLPFPCYDTNTDDPYRTPFNIGICAVNSNVTSGVESTIWQCLATDSVNAVPFGYSASDTLSVGCVSSSDNGTTVLVNYTNAGIATSVTLELTGTVETQTFKADAVNYVSAADSTAIVGDVYFYHLCANNAGIPQTSSKVLNILKAGKVNSTSGIYKIPYGYKGTITDLSAWIDSGEAHVYVYVREVGKQKKLVGETYLRSNSLPISIANTLLPSGSFLEFTAKTASGTQEVGVNGNIFIQND